MPVSAKVRTCLWFEREGLKAARFYTGLIADSAITAESSFDDPANPDGDGVVLVDFTLGGTPYQILQAGPLGQHSDMASISVTTEDQSETDRLWAALIADGGREVQCGWLKDRWGVSWQIVPRRLTELSETGETQKIVAMQHAMMSMKKLDIARLEAAFTEG